MEIFRGIGAVLFGLCGGVVTAAGYFAVINSIGMMNRAASVTRTRGHILLYEDFIVAGVVIGTFLSLYKGGFELPKLVGIAAAGVYGLIAGMFIGLFVVSLAENVKAVPILVKRVNFKAGLGMVFLSMALGKAAGHILYYTVLYK
jgi:stage V sporulation protein AB